MTATAAGSATRSARISRMNRRGVNRRAEGLFYLTPMLLCLAGFFLGPILFGLWSAFQANGTSASGGQFVGFAHFAALLADPRLHASAWITVTFTVGTVAATYGLGLAAAMLLTRHFVGRQIVGALFVVPWTMPLVVVAVVWGWLLDYQFGAVNYVLESLGLRQQPIGFLTDPNVALWSVGVAQVWRLFPLAMITLLGALRSIPSDIYEAARVDGAGGWQTFRFVTLPAIRAPSSALLLLLGIWAFGRVFSIIYVMTGGGPAGATETLVVRTYVEAFSFFQLERASALGVLILVASIILTLLYLRVSRSED